MPWRALGRVARFRQGNARGTRRGASEERERKPRLIAAALGAVIGFCPGDVIRDDRFPSPG